MYYIMAFCAVYPSTSIAWIYTVLNNIIMSWGVFQFVGPVSGGLVKAMVKRCHKQT
jgi:hypothetical protein